MEYMRCKVLKNLVNSNLITCELQVYFLHRGICLLFTDT